MAVRFELEDSLSLDVPCPRRHVRDTNDVSRTTLEKGLQLTIDGFDPPNGLGTIGDLIVGE